MLDAIILLALGVLAASSIIVSANKNAEALVKFLNQFQGYIGVVGFVWGAWTVIQSILNLGWLTTLPIWWITYAAIGGLELILGFIFGFGLISQYALSSNEEAKAKAQEIINGLNPYKITLGLISIGVGVWAIIYPYLGIL